MIHRLLSAPTRAPFALLVLGTVPAALPALPQDDPAEGFALDPVAVAPPTLPGGPFGATVFGAARTLSNGDVVTFDGQTILRLASDGTPLATLGVLPAIAFTGCFAIDPAETLAVVGESSTGEVYRVPLDGSGMTLLTNLTFNYDAVFEDADTVLISAATGVSGNDLVRVDVNTGATTCVALVPSFSGPLAVDPAGGLYYGLQTSPAQVIHWTAGQLDGGACLSELDATVVGDGFAGSTSMAVDPTHGDLYMSVNDFSTGSNRIVRVEGDASVSPVLVEGTTPFHSLSGLQFETGVDGAVFFPYQPAFGGALRYTQRRLRGLQRALRAAAPAAPAPAQRARHLRPRGGDPDADRRSGER